MGQTFLNDVQVGVDTRINISTMSHGRYRVPLANTLAFTPKKSVGLVHEFDNRYPLLAYETYEGIGTAFDCVLADNTVIDGAIMDVDSNTASLVVNDPAQNQLIPAIWCNYKGRNLGYQYACEYAEGSRVSAEASVSSIKDPTKRNYGFEGTRYFRVVGQKGQNASIQYNRFVKTPVFPTADDVASTGSSCTFPIAPFAFPLAGQLTTKNYIALRKNGVYLNGDATLGPIDFSIATTVLTLTAALAVGDVIEAWTVVNSTVV